MSGLVLGLSRGGFVSRMQFGREPVAIAYIELYGGTPGQQVSVVFELARTLNGPPLVSMPGTLAVAGDHYSATAPIPIGTLAWRLHCAGGGGVAGRASTRVERTLREGGGVGVRDNSQSQLPTSKALFEETPGSWNVGS